MPCLSFSAGLMPQAEDVGLMPKTPKAQDVGLQGVVPWALGPVGAQRHAPKAEKVGSVPQAPNAQGALGPLLGAHEVPLEPSPGEPGRFECETCLGRAS